jgi:hypothetical protein
MYRTVLASFWSDPEVKRLVRAGHKDAVYFALYLFTNEHTHVSGIYHLDLVQAERETGCKGAAKLFAMLEDKRWGNGKAGFAFYDEETETVWVRSMLRHQGRGAQNEKAAAKQLRTLHGSRLIAPFLETYPAVAQYCAAEIPIRQAEEPAEAEAEPEKKEAGPRPPSLTAQAAEVWAVYLEELAECKALLKMRDADTPVLTDARREKIIDYLRSHGLERVKDAPRGMRFSDWHMGRVGGKPKLSPEVVFHHTAKIHQIENLSSLYREARAAAAEPERRREGKPAGPVVDVATYRSRIIQELEKRRAAGLMTEGEHDKFTERVDKCKTLQDLKGIVSDLTRKPA